MRRFRIRWVVGDRVHVEIVYDLTKGRLVYREKPPAPAAGRRSVGPSGGARRWSGRPENSMSGQPDHDEGQPSPS